MIKSKEYKFIYDSYDNGIKHTTTNNIKVKIIGKKEM